MLIKFLRRITKNEHSSLTYLMWDFTGTFMVHALVIFLLVLYLSPLAYMFVTSLKQGPQLSDSAAPLYPADPITFMYEGKKLQVYYVPFPEGERLLARVNGMRNTSNFIDPANPGAGFVEWEGSWRALKKVYEPNMHWENYSNFLANFREPRTFPDILRNTLFIAMLGEIGVLLSSIAVAYGFSRFRIPGGQWLFILLIATILIPQSVTLVPTYRFNLSMIAWLKENFPLESVAFLRWISNPLGVEANDSTLYNVLPIVLPHFFGNGIFIFLLRQNFKSIPRDLDEAAMLDGAGPLRILISIILPQTMPVVATVALIHFFYSWNELRLASLYLGTAKKWVPISFSIDNIQGIAGTQEIFQVSAIMLMVVPIVILFLAQPFFMKNMVVTGIEK